MVRGERNDALEVLFRGREITRVEAREPLVEDFFDLAFALGLDPPRLLDPLRGLGVIDVDQENPRPGIDRTLDIAAIQRLLSFREKSRNAAVAFRVATRRGDRGKLGTAERLPRGGGEG